MIILIQIPSTNNNRPSAGAGPCRRQNVKRVYSAVKSYAKAEGEKERDRERAGRKQLSCSNFNYLVVLWEPPKTFR